MAAEVSLLPEGYPSSDMREQKSPTLALCPIVKHRLRVTSRSSSAPEHTTACAQTTVPLPMTQSSAITAVRCTNVVHSKRRLDAWPLRFILVSGLEIPRTSR